MQRRELMMLAHPLDLKKHRIAGRLMSEKIDGQRAWWDGGISRGVLARDVPYANTAKDDRLIDPDYKATGLWSRYGKVIHAPDWFLNDLPIFPLDGELWMGPGTYQQLRSVVGKHYATPDWGDVHYHVFDWPAYQELFQEGRVVSGMHYEKIFDPANTTWVAEKGHDDIINPSSGVWSRYKSMSKWTGWLLGNVIIHPQERLPMQTEAAEERIDEKMNEVLEKGGEGLILRTPHSSWTPKRTDAVLKVKKYSDAEAIVLGYTWGKETDRGSRLLGLMGTLCVEWNGILFELGSGFTNEERELTESHAEYPGDEVADHIDNPRFPRGSTVTFKYRELSDDGVPKEGTYWRTR